MVRRQVTLLAATAFLKKKWWYIISLTKKVKSVETLNRDRLNLRNCGCIKFSKSTRLEYSPKKPATSVGLLDEDDSQTGLTVASLPVVVVTSVKNGLVLLIDGVSVSRVTAESPKPSTWFMVWVKSTRANSSYIVLLSSTLTDDAHGVILSGADPRTSEPLPYWCASNRQIAKNEQT